MNDNGQADRSGLWRPLRAFLQPACSVSHPPLRTADKVDIKRFMGDWCVVACIPTVMERDAFSAVESYSLNDDGTVATQYSFNKGAYSGVRKTVTSKGYVDAQGSGAIWQMQLFGLIRADFRIVYIDDDYTQAIIGREKRDYVWILSRTSDLSPGDYFELVRRVREQGYDTNRLREVPHRRRVPVRRAA